MRCTPNWRRSTVADENCGDYPAPCNCDDPVTHDRPVDPTAKYWTFGHYSYDGGSMEGPFDTLAEAKGTMTASTSRWIVLGHMIEED